MNEGPILFCGDPHGGVRGSLQYIIEAARDTQASAVILLGDIEPARPLHEELGPILDRVWWIPGNHDSDSDDVWRRVATPEMAARNLHGRVVTLPDSGLRIAGLGGVFRESVWHPSPASARGGVPAFRTRAAHAKATPRQDRWEGGHHRKHCGSIYPDEVDHLAELRADVLVTHEAPGYHPNGFDILDVLAQSLGVKVAVHGHQHDRLDSSTKWEAQGFKSFGVGLRGITAISVDGVDTVVRPGELDEAREDRGLAS
ncbi:metallophosphoesterase family protein [Scleromatobacter humisilvae]|uniref:Metallophosphoesterase n=1 Tax=Scleromatobacter humisilvae TaxID=2897159 RepID=A0A9X2C191_9BURK|nr:metallophosphoesterase [Scleromatobacter humisilvae]MCK9687331.1 metallophosphoesterase [Scleromatobacter humisilvae]